MHKWKYAFALLLLAPCALAVYTAKAWQGTRSTDNIIQTQEASVSTTIQATAGLPGMTAGLPDTTGNQASAFVFESVGLTTPRLIPVSVTQQSVYLDNKPLNIAAYNIEGANYFRLRDLAQILQGTEAQFSIESHAGDYTIEVNTGAAYTPRGDELEPLRSMVSSMQPSPWKLAVNGEPVAASAYTIEGSNFYKLRDMGHALGFFVRYDQASHSVHIASTFTAEVPPDAAVAPSWFDDAVFFGDSVSGWLFAYAGEAGLGDATFLTGTSFGIENALGEVSDSSYHPTYQGTKMKLDDAVVACGAKKVYIMLGMNDIDYGQEKIVKDYVKLVEGIQAKSPDVQIYIQSVTPMIRTSKRATETFNNATVKAFNDAMKEQCQAHRWNYLDIASVFSEADGCLREEVCSDSNLMGLHLTQEATKEWVEYLRTHTR